MSALTLVSIETTQAIQTFPARVPLVAHKATMVRLMVRHNLWAGAAPLARARMRVVPVAGPPSAWFDPANGTNPPKANPGVLLPLSASPNRETTDDTFNFRIPAALCEGTVQWEFEVRLDAKTSPHVPAADQRLKQLSVPTRFHPRRALEVRYLRVLYPSLSGTSHVRPTDEQCVSAIRAACQLLPTAPPVVVEAFDLALAIEFSWGDAAMWDLLRRIRWFREGLETLSGTSHEPNTDSIWCGIIVVPGHEGMGIASPGILDVVATPHAVAIAHEMAHCYLQNHLLADCPVFGIPAQADDSSEFEAGGQIVDVPFDVIGNRVAPRPPGKSYWDLMTYCQGTTWMSGERWRRLWSRFEPV